MTRASQCSAMWVDGRVICQHWADIVLLADSNYCFTCLLQLREMGVKHLSKLILVPEEHADIFEVLKRLVVCPLSGCVLIFYTDVV